jgi:hypothetical protein
MIRCDANAARRPEVFVFVFSQRSGVSSPGLRLQTMEVAGQEILTRDKVGLRVNLTALWQIIALVS